jgi:hypothetical protein
MEVSCGAAGIVRAGFDVVCPDAIAGKPAPTRNVFVPGIYVRRRTCGSWLASDPPQAAIHTKQKGLCSAIKKRCGMKWPAALLFLQSA